MQFSNSAILQSVIIQSVILQSAILQSVIIQSAILQSAILQSVILQSAILQSVFIQSASYGFVFGTWDIRVSVGLFLETVHVMLLFRVNKTVASHALFTFRLVGETSVLYNSKIDTLSYSLKTECWSGLFPFVQPSIC